ncbi:hypothetical protein [Nonomuraea rubra]|uniref:hypothetical protein n=1 Tax=Nonomuraea rubra TaxID=46180 RepID=UPI0033F3DA72
MIHRFTVGDLACAVSSDGRPEPPWVPPLTEFYTPATGCRSTSCGPPWRGKGSAGPR